MSGRGGGGGGRVEGDASVMRVLVDALFFLDRGGLSRDVVIVHVVDVVSKEADEHTHNSLLFFAGHVVPLVFA